VIPFILSLKINKNHLVVFLIGCLIRIIPEIIAYPYPIGYDNINYYIPLANEVEFDSVKDQINIFPYLIYILKVITSLGPHNLMIVLSSTIYGLFSLSIYLLLEGLAIKPAWLMTIFILFQLSTLRTTWDLQKDILAFSFTFLIFYLILKDRKLYLYKKKVFHFCLIVSLVIITIFTDIMVSFLLIISLSIYFSIKKDKKYIIFLIILIIVGFLVLIDNINNNPLGKNINKILKGNIKENINYTPLNLGILFIMMNILLFPFFIYGIKNLHELLLYIPLSLALVGSFTWLVLPYSSILLPDRWITISGIFISIFSSYGLIRLFSSKPKNKPNYKIILPIISLYIFIGLFYMTLPNDYAFPIYGIFSNYTQKFVPTTMQFNSIDIMDNRDLLITIDWLNNNTNSKSIIYGDPHLRGWMKTLLKDQRTFKYNYTNFSKNGIYIILADNINLENYPVKLLFSQGVFKIIEK
jgi:hypothetical protein